MVDRVLQMAEKDDELGPPGASRTHVSQDDDALREDLVTDEHRYVNRGGKYRNVAADVRSADRSRRFPRRARYLKEENLVLRTRVPGQVHTRPEKHQRLLEV